MPNGVSGQSLQTEIRYHPTASSTEVKTILLGLQITVQPLNLFNALTAWKDGAAEDPTALLDRVERILQRNSRPRD